MSSWYYVVGGSLSGVSASLPVVQQEFVNQSSAAAIERASRIINTRRVVKKEEIVEINVVSQ